MQLYLYFRPFSVFTDIADDNCQEDTGPLPQSTSAQSL